VNLLRDNRDTIKRNTDTSIDASKQVGLEVNIVKAKYMLVSHHQNAGRNLDIRIGNRSFKYVAQFKYLGMIVTNQDLFHEEIKRKLNSGNACYHSACLLSQHVKIGVYSARFEVFTVVTMKNAIFWDLMPCDKQTTNSTALSPQVNYTD
jgi:hypothetical protein